MLVLDSMRRDNGAEVSVDFRWDGGRERVGPAPRGRHRENSGGHGDLDGDFMEIYGDQALRGPTARLPPQPSPAASENFLGVLQRQGQVRELPKSLENWVEIPR